MGGMREEWGILYRRACVRGAGVYMNSGSYFTCAVGHESHDERLDRFVHRLVFLRVARVSAVDVLLGQGGSGGTSSVRIDIIPTVQFLRSVVR